MANVTTYSAFTDAQSQNDISRNVRQYRDLDLFFFKKQGSGDVNKITDIETESEQIKRNNTLGQFYLHAAGDSIVIEKAPTDTITLADGHASACAPRS